MANQATKTLVGQDALDLWKQGRDAWNKWAEKNPEYNVSFEGVDFSPYIDRKLGISFNGYQFPKGNVYFIGAEFGEGVVYFRESEFGKRETRFDDSTFNGNADFSGLKGCGSVELFSFRNVSF